MAGNRVRTLDTEALTDSELEIVLLARGIKVPASREEKIAAFLSLLEG